MAAKSLSSRIGDSHFIIQILAVIAKCFSGYKLIASEKLSSIHNTFHVSNLKKCLSDESLVIPMKELQLDDKLNFVEEPVEVMDREIKKLKRSRIPIVKVRWNSKRGPKILHGKAISVGVETYNTPQFHNVNIHLFSSFNILMLLQRLSTAIIRFLIQEVWSWFQDVVVQSSGIVTTGRYVVPTGRVNVPAGRYVVPTGKNNVIVSTGRTKVIPAGRTILVLVVLSELIV
ncbi:hypothetical protein Tco_0988299 [Tanacetum coccineum]|uniref:Reverse transcriptase domain-containing protein n=1 Tax=Tanacetum coccineum TaxID=301880 RepID=A0ABQ5EQL8_9ASTR